MQNETNVQAAAPVHYDQMLQITACSLLALGMAMIFISSTLMAQSQYNDAYYFIKRQGVYALLGLGALFLGRSIDYHRYKRWIYCHPPAFPHLPGPGLCAGHRRQGPGRGPLAAAGAPDPPAVGVRQAGRGPVHGLFPVPEAGEDEVFRHRLFAPHGGGRPLYRPDSQGTGFRHLRHPGWPSSLPCSLWEAPGSPTSSWP